MNPCIKITLILIALLLNMSCSTQHSQQKTIEYQAKPKEIENKILSPHKKNAKIVNGRREGSWLWLDADGNRYLEAEYAQNEAHGKWTYYYKNGQQKRIEFYKRGKPSGTWKYFSEKGELQMEILHLREMPMREHIFYYPEGRIAYRQKYLKTDIYRLDGYSAEYYPNGRLRFETHFEQGEIAGYQRWYYPNGQLMMEGYQKDGRHLGIWTKYNPNGEIKDRTIAPDPHWVYQHIPLE